MDTPLIVALVAIFLIADALLVAFVLRRRSGGDKARSASGSFGAVPTTGDDDDDHGDADSGDGDDGGTATVEGEGTESSRGPRVKPLLRTVVSRVPSERGVRTVRLGVYAPQ